MYLPRCKLKLHSLEVEQEGERRPVERRQIETINLCKPWFKVAVSVADSGTVSHQSRRYGPDSGEARETLHRGIKKF